MTSIINDNKKWIDDVWHKLEHKLSSVAVKSREKLPYTTVDGVHDNLFPARSEWWTNGFWGGMMWLMYKETGNEEFRITAERSELMLDNALKNFKCLHHDVGFMWHLTSGANYRITGNTDSLNRNLFAASTLFSRYNVDGGFIRAWNDDNAENWSIIDCLMNIPLLYWASEEVGDSRFAKIAMKHADMSLTQHIRHDGSVNHIVEHNPENPELFTVYRGQGYSETSCWTRGLAWAIYGMVLSFIHTKKQAYLDAAIKTSDYYIEKCEKYNFIPPIDFASPKSPEYVDTTAGVCAACGLIELSKLCKDNGEKYLSAAIKTLKNISEKYCDYTDSNDSIVQMGSERYPHNPEDFKGIHIPIIYGDFFFVEAILKLKGSDFLIW